MICDAFDAQAEPALHQFVIVIEVDVRDKGAAVESTVAARARLVSHKHHSARQE